jgi:hypothetical protein
MKKIVTITFLLLPIFIFARENPELEPETFATAQITLKSKKVEFARPFKVEIELPAPAVFDAGKSLSENFEIISQKQNKEDILKTTVTVLPFNLGEQEFPPVVFIDENGREIKTKPLKIDVKPTKTKIKTQGLADIRPPYRPFNYLRLCALILLTAAMLYAYLRFKKSRAKRADLSPANPYISDGRPYHIIALEQIDKLFAENLWEQGLYKIFYIRAVDILCDYIAVRFKINAHLYTSRDLINTMRTVAEFNGDIYDLRKFLNSADLVKFAKVLPTCGERDLDINLLRTIINDTKQPQEDVQETEVKN